MISYDEYKRIIEEKFSSVLKENLLFWNLWNITYPFEKLKQYKTRHSDFFDVFNNMWELCWTFNDSNHIDLEEFHKLFDQYYPFDIDDDGEIINPKGILQQSYEDLTDDNFAEFCINKLISGFDEIYSGLTTSTIYGKNAGGLPVEIIGYILSSNDMGFFFDNVDLPIVQNEINAQIKLINELSKPQQFTFADRNIFRNEEDMNSVKYETEVDKYLKGLETQFKEIPDNNILFWDVWMCNYLYDQYKSGISIHYSDSVHDLINSIILYLWDVVDNIDKLDKTKINSFHKQLQNIDLEDIDTDEEAGLGVYELIVSVDRTLSFLETSNRGYELDIAKAAISIILYTNDLDILNYYDFDEDAVQEEIEIQLKMISYLKDNTNLSSSFKNIFRD